MKRVAIIGCSGAGKSTLARQLGDILNIPVIHLDAFYWKPGWVSTEHMEWLKIQQSFVQQAKWIIDGNYTSTMDTRLAIADTIIMLDFPRLLCLYRALKRYVHHIGKTRPDMNEGCPERIDWGHLKWIWTFPSDGRIKALNTINLYREGRNIHILHSPAEVKHFLAVCRREQGSNRSSFLRLS